MAELNLMCSRSQQDNVSSLNAQVIRLPAGIESSVSLSQTPNANIEKYINSCLNNVHHKYSKR
jgi:hypothetical protein